MRKRDDNDYDDIFDEEETDSSEEYNPDNSDSEDDGYDEDDEPDELDNEDETDNKPVTGKKKQKAERKETAGNSSFNNIKKFLKQNTTVAIEACICIICVVLMSVAFVNMRKGNGSSGDSSNDENVDILQQDDSFVPHLGENEDDDTFHEFTTDDLLEEAEDGLDTILCLIVAGDYDFKKGNTLTLDSEGNVKITEKDGKETSGTYKASYIDDAGEDEDPYLVEITVDSEKYNGTVDQDVTRIKLENGETLKAK